MPPGRVDLTLTGLTQEALRPWLPENTVNSIDARVSATLGLDLASAEVSGISGTLVLDEASLTAAGVPITQARPAHMSIAQGVLYFDDVAFSAGDPVMFGGSIASGDPITLDMTITGTPSLRPLSVLSPQLSVDGQATFDLVPDRPGRHRRGSPAASTSRKASSCCAIRGSSPRTSPGRFCSRATASRFRASTGSMNGGSLDASGRVTLDGLAVTGGEIAFQARGVAVEYPEDVDSEIDALLTLIPGQGDVGAPLLRGDVRVLRGAYRATVSLPALVAFNRAPVAADDASAYLDALRLDIAVSTEEDLVVDNNYGRFEAGANLRLTGHGGPARGRPAASTCARAARCSCSAGSTGSTTATSRSPTRRPSSPISAISMSTRSSGAESTVTLSGTAGAARDQRDVERSRRQREP